ncbi:hypothetical protein [Ottowia sp.]|uniref:hypothetical protein n=1 Tax=Ottowia sp. TaxID=1898956 RepID=UPI002D1CC358|nr:hypothetical protein [Ottowia sp.]HRN77301.1 hypothetical protein [Ottowia sp.]
MMTTHEKPAGAGEHAAGLGSNADDSRIIPSTGDNGKSFSALAAKFALAGHALIRVDPTGGLAPYIAMRWGYNIETELYDGWAADGYSHQRMARYELVGEPTGGAE